VNRPRRRTRWRVGGWEFSARLWRSRCCRGSTPGSIARFAAPERCSVAVTSTRGTSLNPLSRFRKNFLAAFLSRQKLTQTRTKWITRVPATVNAAQTVLAHADPQTLALLKAGYRYHKLTSTYGGIEPRWVLIYSESRRAQAHSAVDKQWRQQSDKEINALKKLCGTAFACEADARQALSTFEQDLHATFLSASTVRAQPRYGKRGRPGQDARPAQVVYQIDGALASALTARQALIDQHSCFILATNELDTTQPPPQEVLEGYKGQVHAERGFRFLKDPQFLASSLYLKKPERIMALLMVMTVCLLVYAALEYRIRKALKDHEATFPDQQGKRIQQPTARWVFHYFVGIHLLCQAGQWPIVLNLTAEHQLLLRRLGQPYMWLYDVQYSQKSRGRCGMSDIQFRERY
jgi:transposase